MSLVVVYEMFTLPLSYHSAGAASYVVYARV